MSFQDLEGGAQRNYRAKQWCVEEVASFEQQIRTNIQQLQASVGHASEQLDRSQGARTSKRIGDSFTKSLEQGQMLTQETEQLFRDWTVHLAGEPTARHKKKFSYEKLQKAFREEVENLKEARRRASAVQVYSAGTAIECHSVCEDQVSSISDEEHCLLANSENHDVAVVDEFTTRIVAEREEGLKRIQAQVTDVNQMFRDLASIVNEQGQQFETIEQQAETASASTKQVTRELKKTVDMQRSNFDRLCCMMVSTTLVLCFVVASNFHHMPHFRASHLG